MKTKKFTIAVLCLTLLSTNIFTSCKTNNKLIGAGIGVIAGGVIGGIMGNNLGNKENSALGTAIGSLVGGTIGAVSVDGKDKLDRLALEIEKILPSAKLTKIGNILKIVFNKSSIGFETGKSNLTLQSMTNIDKLAKILNDYSDTEINIFGHTDNTGNPDINLDLSLERANAVKDYLISKDVNENRLSAKGFGSNEPIETNDTEEGREKNRRVEFEIKINKKLKKKK
jgi:outer membrane protein OmpA-like peptidoglycan-associated protein